MKCNKCTYFLDIDKISVMSRMLGYKCECNINNVLFKEIPEICQFENKFEERNEIY